MTHPILDRVAKAIEEAPAYGALKYFGDWKVIRVNGRDDDVLYRSVSRHANESDADAEASRLTSQSRARAAIEAMRELPDELEVIGDHAARGRVFPTHHVWQAMIDSILSQEEGK